MSQFFNHLIKFDCPAIPARVRSIIAMEINYSSEDEYLEQENIFLALSIDGTITIPSWMVIKWIEEGKLIKMRKVGVKSINVTLNAITRCLSE